MSIDQSGFSDFYFHVGIRINPSSDGDDQFFICKILYDGNFKLFVLLESKWICCTEYSISDVLEPFSKLLGVSWLRLNDQLCLSLVTSRFIVYVEKKTFIDHVVQFINARHSNSPSVSPILPIVNNLEENIGHSRVTIKKFHFDRTIYSYTQLWCGILVSDGSKLGFILHPDAIPWIIPNIGRKVELLKSISFASGASDGTFSSIALIYFEKDDEYHLLQAKFSTTDSVPIFNLLPSSRGFQDHARSSILSLPESIDFSVSLYGSITTILLSSYASSYVANITIYEENVSSFLMEKHPNAFMFQAYLVSFNGQLTDNEVSFISSCPIEPLFPRAFSIMYFDECLFLCIGDLKCQIPFQFNSTLLSLNSNAINVFVYDHKVLILVDQQLSSPLCYEMDILSKFIGLGVNDSVSLDLYKLLLIYNSVIKKIDFLFKLLEDIFSVLIVDLDSIFMRLKEYLNEHKLGADIYNAIRFLSLCLFEESNLSTTPKATSSTKFFNLSTVLQNIFSISPFGVMEFSSMLISSSLNSSEMSQFSFDSLIQYSKLGCFLFPRTYFLILNWIDIEKLDFASISSMLHLFHFFNLLVERPKPSVTVLNIDACKNKCLYKTSTTSIESLAQSISNSNMDVSLYSDLFPVSLILLLNEKYRRIQHSLNYSNFGGFNPRLTINMLKFYDRLDILATVEELSPCDVLSNVNNSLSSDFSLSMLALDTKHNLSFFRLDQDQSQVESFFGIEKFTSIYVREADLLKAQSILSEIVSFIKLAIPNSILLASANKIKYIEVGDIPLYFSHFLSQLRQKIHFSTHSTSPSLSLFKLNHISEFLLCTKATIDIKHKIDISSLLSLKPKSKAPFSFASVYHWAAFLYGLGLSAKFTNPLPQDVILEFISAPESTNLASITSKNSSQMIASIVNACSFLLFAGISYIGSKDRLLIKASSIHFPSLVFLNNLLLSKSNGFSSSVISYPIIDLPQHCVVMSAFLCSGLLYAQSPNLQLFKILIKEFVYLFNTNQSCFDQNAFTFKNSGCRWYWSSHCHLSKMGFFTLKDLKCSNDVYDQFLSVTDTILANTSQSSFLFDTGIKRDNQFYPFYLSRIKGFSLEGHSLVVGFSLGLALFSLGIKPNIFLDRIYFQYTTLLFVLTSKKPILNHPIAISPLLLSLCMSSFNRHSSHSKVIDYISSFLVENQSFFSMRMDILFYLNFYTINCAIENYLFYDYKQHISAEALWLLGKIGIDFSSIKSHCSWDLASSFSFLQTSSQFLKFKKILFNPLSAENELIDEIVAKFNLVIKNPFFINQVVVSCFTSLLAYFHAKILFFLQSQAHIPPTCFNFLYFCVGYLYYALDYPFIVLVEEGLIANPSFAFTKSGFNFKSSCASYMSLLESFISVTALANMATPCTEFVKFLEHCQQLNLSTSNIFNAPNAPKKASFVQALFDDPDDILNFSILRSLFNNTRYHSCIARSLGFLLMAKSDLEMFNYPIALPLLFVSTMPFSDEIIQPELHFPDFASDSDEMASTSLLNIVVWDRLPIHCRYFFLRLLKPSKLFKSSEEAIVNMNRKMESHINILTQDVQTKQPISGVLTFPQKNMHFTVPSIQSLELVHSLQNESGILTCEGSYKQFFPIHLSSFLSSFAKSPRPLLLFAKQSSEISFSSCNSSFLYNISFPTFPNDFSDHFISLHERTLNVFSHLLQKSIRNTLSLKLFFDDIILDRSSVTCNSVDDDFPIQILKDTSKLFQLCHYLYSISRLDEFYPWVRIHYSAFPCGKSSLVYQYRSAVVSDRKGDIQFAHQSYLYPDLERVHFKDLLHYLLQLHPKNMLYSYYYQMLLFYVNL